MNVLGFTALLFSGAAAAGFVGALTGLGGGVVLIPLLTLGLGVDIKYAIGTALVAVIATSSGAAAAYVREGFSNVRIGLFFEIATTLGALLGAFLATRTPTSAIAVIFGAVLLGSTAFSWKGHAAAAGIQSPDPLATRLGLNGSFPSLAGEQAYFPRRVPLAWLLMVVAGAVSGLLGIGSGALKVLSMDAVLKLPYKVSTTTSNFMIGVTAAASAGVYLSRGYIDPALAAPAVLGVLAGSALGARILTAARSNVLRLVFTAVVLVMGIQMIVQGLRGAV
ncbi:MAG: sulfite exporter TauE/SafE family protein [Thermoanaerobaculia bacterium]